MTDSNTDDPCPRCHSTVYDRKLALDIGGTPVTVCNVCAPTKVEVPLEIEQDDSLVTTGFFRATLDWREKNVVVASKQEWHSRSRWQRLRAWARHLWQPSSPRT